MSIILTIIPVLKNFNIGIPLSHIKTFALYFTYRKSADPRCMAFVDRHDNTSTSYTLNIKSLWKYITEKKYMKVIILRYDLKGTYS